MSAANAPRLPSTFKFEKGLTRPKDTNAPKKPLSGYFQWAAENREAAKSQCATAGAPEITKKLGSMWAALPKEEKDKWDLKAKSETAAWKVKYEAYKKTSEYAEFEKELMEFNIRMTHKPFQKDGNMPKKAQSAYMLFAADERPKVVAANPNLKVTEVMGHIGKAWKDLSADGKKPYVDKAKKLSDEHAKVAAKYKESKEHKDYLEEKKAYTTKMTNKRKRLLKQVADSGMEFSSERKPKKARKTTEKKDEDSLDVKDRKFLGIC